MFSLKIFKKFHNSYFLIEHLWQVAPSLRVVNGNHNADI